MNEIENKLSKKLCIQVLHPKKDALFKPFCDGQKGKGFIFPSSRLGRAGIFIASNRVKGWRIN